MKMNCPLLVLCLSTVALVKGADWCYTGCANTPDLWAGLAGSSCGGSSQSPIDIVTGTTTTSLELTEFTFVKFSNVTAVKNITFTGHSVQCDLEGEMVEFSGGGLNGTYVVSQFHLHWGDGTTTPGSEHTIDSKRYPMELHIVSTKKGITEAQALLQEDGFAVLGFFIDAAEITSEPWQHLTYYLTNETTPNTIDPERRFSIDDLLGKVNRAMFYRYKGSLTTPTCDEAVVWTIFHDPIQVPTNLIQLFSTATGVQNSYRPAQDLNNRSITASPFVEGHWCYNDECGVPPNKWSLLDASHCDGTSQSPVNIVSKSATVNTALGSFTFKNFNDKTAIKSITNTGHSVQCDLVENHVEVSGGGLPTIYQAIQFHFHWGTNTTDSTGSEHTVDSKRYPMEMHIVTKKKDLTIENALATSDGLAVLGFFIEALPDRSSSHSSGSTDTSTTTASSPWESLTGHLKNITTAGAKVNVADEISIDDLLGNVNRNSYYRYMGSLTTPSCNEAVIWTVFKESIKMEQRLMMLFPKHAGYQQNYRPAMALNTRKIYTSSASGLGPSGSTLLLLLLPCLLSRNK